MALPTPAQVKNLPLSPAIKAVFAAVDDERVQEFIDNCASAFGSAEVKRHKRRDEAVKYGAAHLLYMQLQDEGLLPGGGGGGGGAGLLSSVTLTGVGTRSYAVKALEPEQEVDWLARKTPLATKLHMILKTFPPGIAITGWPCEGPPQDC